MQSLLAFVSLAALANMALSSPTEVGTAKRATCTVNSVSSSESLSSCSTVVIEAFSVPSGGEYIVLRIHVLFKLMGYMTDARFLQKL